MSEILVAGDAPVFIVDDDLLFQDVMAFAFSNSTLSNEVVALSSGFECLEKLRALHKKKNPLPSLILMDIHMPEMSGIETIEKIRGDEGFEDIPIVSMLSSDAEPENKEKARLAGANDFFEKPFDITTVKFLSA